MTEEFLHFLWKNKLFNTNDLVTDTGEQIEIIDVGLLNPNAGPDFINSKIKINNTIWAGNVEIHFKASDWVKHKHNKDKTYNNVILQVVNNPDSKTYLENGQALPTMQLEFDKLLLDNYSFLLKSQTWIPCQESILLIDNFIFDSWLNNLLIEKLENKAVQIESVLKSNQNNWEDSFYQLLARNFGFQVNSFPFELLAKSLPLKCLGANKNNLLHIESLLFGQAGLLESSDGEDYYLKLRKEYSFLKSKYSLKAIDPKLWKFLRLRPVNFPTIRIAQFAYLIHISSHLFSKIIETEKIDEIYKLFEIKTSEYWETHYMFNKESKPKVKSLGHEAIDIIIINTIVPFLFIYGKCIDNENLKNRAIELLELIKPENNSITKKWTEIGINIPNAYYSQSLLWLKNEYCSKNRCINCQVGYKLIKNKAL